MSRPLHAKSRFLQGAPIIGSALTKSAQRTAGSNTDRRIRGAVATHAVTSRNRDAQGALPNRPHKDQPQDGLDSVVANSWPCCMGRLRIIFPK
jgi:hypothetical protein